MIWIDSSFAIDWLLKNPRAQHLADKPFREQTAILPLQLAEIYIYFEKANLPTQELQAQLNKLELGQCTFEETKLASSLYLMARKKKKKASLADAFLASVVMTRHDSFLSFDNDFHLFGFYQQKGFWLP